MKASTALEETAAFPAYRDALKALVEEHKHLEEEPLLLALYYAPERDPRDIFLFEVADNFGANTVSTERNLFEVTYGSTSGLELERDQHLHLVLTNPYELRVATREGWPLAEEVRKAVRAGRFEELYVDPAHRDILNGIDA